jgi:hypothetical protein
MARFHISPSRLARFYFHECERYLRYSTATNQQRAVDAIPAPGLDRTLVTRAVLARGHEWERQVLDRLGDRAVVPTGPGDVTERRHTAAATLDLLADASAGDAIYQPTLRAPASFCAAYGLDPDLVEFVDCHPDLLLVDETDDGLEVRVVDAKATDEMKLSHRIQTTLYTLLLRHVLAEAGHDEGLRASREGGIWLAGRDEPEWFGLAAIAPHLETFLAHELTPLLETPAAEAFWHVGFRCEWCDYYSHCRAEAERTDDVSLVPYLSTFAKRHLHDVGVESVADLRDLLGQPDRDQLLAGSASLDGRAAELALLVDALGDGTERPTGAASIGMPAGEQVRVVLTLQSEPVTGAVYGYAINRFKGEELFGRAGDTVARVAADGDPETLTALRRDLVRDLHRILRTVHDHNVAHAEWNDQKALQAYVFDSYERTLLVDALLLAVQDPDVAPEALTLLFYFQHPDIVEAEHHPSSEVFFPLVVLTQVIRSVVALPIPVAYSFAAVVDALARRERPFTYRHDDYWCFPLSNRMTANAIFSVWRDGRADLVPNIENELQRRVWAASSVIDGLRERLDGTGALFAWPPKLRLPDGFGFRDATLSRLAFITRYEGVLSYLAIRNARSEPAAERYASGRSILLRYERDDWFHLDGPSADQILEPTSFLNHVLTIDDDGGRRARLAFDDFVFRTKSYASARRPVALAEVVEVTDAGRVRLKLVTGKAWTAPRPGQRCVLEPRFTDWNAARVIEELGALDAAGDSWFARLVADPAATPRPLRVGPAVRADALDLAARHGMTPSQLDAFGGVVDSDVQLVWGPPGTGKTHFLAVTVLALLEAHRRAGRPLSVLVTGFTHAAIDNCLDKIVTLQDSLGVLCEPLAIRKLKAATARVDALDPDSACGFCARHARSVVGATVWQARRTPPEEHRYDVVVIDEASQVKVGEAALAIRRVEPGGRLVVAGDDQQLPPIVQGAYPELDGEPLLHRSILECLRGTDDRPGAPLVTLLENFRMCDTLCEYPRTSIYPEDYLPATRAIGEARPVYSSLPGSAASGPTADFLAAALDPDYAAVMCVVDGVKATAENQVEAALVADLALELRRLWPDESDEEFWRDRLFVVSPHRAQNRAIRRELAARRRWDAQPFVDTVDKMQGQECDVVIVSYGVSDVEYALQEKEFIYSLNRLNVAITRARMKSIVLLSRSLLEPPVQALDRDDVAEGIAFMQGFKRFCEGDDHTAIALGQSNCTIVAR